MYSPDQSKLFMMTSIYIAHIIHITRDNMPKVRPALHRFSIIAINSELCITNQVEFITHWLDL